MKLPEAGMLGYLRVFFFFFLAAGITSVLELQVNHFEGDREIADDVLWCCEEAIIITRCCTKREKLEVYVVQAKAVVFI